MDKSRLKKLVVEPTIAKDQLASFVSALSNVFAIYAEPSSVTEGKVKTMFESDKADMVVCKDLDSLKKMKREGKIAGFRKAVTGNQDIDELWTAAELGADFVIVEAADWKIIPLENIIARLHKTNTEVYATAESSDEVKILFSVLELGVDGVILASKDQEEISRSSEQLQTKFFELMPAKIVEVKDVANGERVCVDTVSMMTLGEGMLVGSRSNFMLLIHNESVGSSFTSPRPFRVNAGALYCYTVTPDGKTRYLSEIESGTDIWIVNRKGVARKTVVGRSKIETRPLRLIKAQIGSEMGTVILQNAETIRLIGMDGNLISVTCIKPGDEVLGYTRPVSGRHFGMQVDEYVVEK